MRTSLKSAALSGLLAVAGCGGVPDADPPVVHVDEVVGLVTASDDTTRQSGVQTWEVWRSASGLTVIALDQSGVRTPALEVVHGRAGALTIATGGGRLALDARGAVIADGLSPAARTTLALLSHDLAAAPRLHGALSCAVSLLAVVGSSAACGASAGVACLGVPAAFCGASKQCGANVCGF
jgi:hypothetical protein